MLNNKDKYIHRFLSIDTSLFFTIKLQEYNAIFGQQQLENIYNTFAIINNKNKFEKYSNNIKNNIGCKVSIESNLRADEILFSETGGFLLEASDENIDNITKCFSEYDLEVFVIGKTVKNNIMINDALNISIEQGPDAWENRLTNKL